MLLTSMAKSILMLLSFTHCLLYCALCQLKAYLLVLSAFQGNTFLMKCHLGVLVTSWKSLFHDLGGKYRKKNTLLKCCSCNSSQYSEYWKGGEEREEMLAPRDASAVFNNEMKRHNVFRVPLASLRLLYSKYITDDFH